MFSNLIVFLLWPWDEVHDRPAYLVTIFPSHSVVVVFCVCVLVLWIVVLRHEWTVRNDPV